MNIKEHIATVSMTQFSQQGIRVVTMDSIAKLMGISKRTLCENFTCKEDLVQKCVSQDVALFESFFIEKLTCGGSSLACLVDIFTFLYGKSQSYNPAYIDDIHRNPELSEIARELKEMIQKNVEMLYYQAVAEGYVLLEKDFKILSFLLNELIVRRFSHNRQQSVDIFQKAIVAVLMGLCTEKGRKELKSVYCSL